MSQDFPIPRQENRSDGLAVVEWGSAEPTRPGRVARFGGGLGRDHRLPIVLVALGAAAALASLIGEWLVMTVPNNGPEGNSSLRVPSGVAEVGGFGIGYLVGLLGLAGAVALALGGTRGVRQNARVLGTGLAAALLALLAAAAFSLDDTTRRSLFYSADSGFQVEYGRGLVMAFVAVALLGAALRLAATVDRPAASGGRPATADENGGETVTTGGDRPGSAEAGDDRTDAAVDVGEPRSGFGWRRGRRRERAEEPEVPPAPEGLTVESAAPFARPEPPDRR